MRRMTMVAAAVLALVLTGAALAAKPVITKGPPDEMDFVIPAGQCPNLPAGMSVWSVDGTVTGHSITLEKTQKGVYTRRNETQIHGTATDGVNTYTFNYENSFTVSSTDGGGTLTGTMVDTFSLAGNGSAHLNNGFRANVTIDATGFHFDPLSQRGSPLDFSSGTPMCDPL